MKPSWDYWFLLKVRIDFMRLICMFVKEFENIFIFYVCSKVSYVCFQEVPCYYDKQIQFVILLNMWYLDNAKVFSFPKHIILKKYDVQIPSKGMAVQSFWFLFFYFVGGTNWNPIARKNPTYIWDKGLTNPTYTCVVNSICFGDTRFKVTCDALGGFQIWSMYKFYGPYKRERGLILLWCYKMI